MTAKKARSSLQNYAERRDFRQTPEPKASRRGNGDGPIFVIQEHDATTRHWDLRLEVDGVLKSWALPKGPSTDPREKRLAQPTEDHPVRYADFEGVIPEGEYGAGPVIVWDRGTYRNLREETDDEQGRATMAESLEEGKVEVWLEGEKLRGGWALVRADLGDRESWLLVKMKDEGADARRRPTSTQPESVLSGRTVEEVSREMAR